MGIEPDIGMTSRPPITLVPLAIAAQEESDEEKL